VRYLGLDAERNSLDEEKEVENTTLELDGYKI
jgi:hypothetical protein